VGFDRLGGVDGLVADRGVDVLVPADDLGDMGRQAAHDGIGHEDSPEIVRGEHERVAGGVGEAGRGERVDEQLADRAGSECPVLAADGPLEQQRHGRVPDPFPDVVGDGQRDVAAGSPEPADGRRQDIGQLGADQEQSLRIGLARGDLQQRDELAGRGQPVLGDAMVSEFQELLAADPGQPQDLDRGEAPERFFFLIRQVAALAGSGVLGPHVPPVGLGRDGPAERRVSALDDLAGRCRHGGLQVAGGRVPAVGRGACEDGQDGQPLAGPLVHPGLAPPAFLGPVDLGVADRARDCPLRPASGLLHGPLGDVEIERPDAYQLVLGVDPRAGDDGFAPVGAGDAAFDGQQAFLPGAGDLRRQLQRADARGQGLDPGPEQAGQGP
jgi:hypothetical protein